MDALGQGGIPNPPWLVRSGGWIKPPNKGEAVALAVGIAREYQSRTFKAIKALVKDLSNGKVVIRCGFFSL
jgi:hypothetical protein